MVDSRVKMVSGFQDKQVVFEYTAAVAANELLYPGIAQCITVTGCTNIGLIGAHISPGSNQAEIKDVLKLLSKAGIKASSSLYIIGNIHHFVSSSTAIWKSKQEIANKIKKELGNLPILLYNTSALASQFNWGIDIIALRNGNAADFDWRAATGPAKKTINRLNGMYENY